MILPRVLIPVMVARYVPDVEELREQLVATVLFDVKETGEAGHEIERPLGEIDVTWTESSKLILFSNTGMTAPDAPELKLIEGFGVDIL